MLIEIDSYEVHIVEVPPSFAHEYDGVGWYWHVPWMPPEGPFGGALDALQDFARAFEANRLLPRPKLKL